MSLKSRIAVMILTNYRNLLIQARLLSQQIIQSDALIFDFGTRAVDHILDKEFAVAQFADFSKSALFFAWLVKAKRAIGQEVALLFKAVFAVGEPAELAVCIFQLFGVLPDPVARWASLRRAIVRRRHGLMHEENRLFFIKNVHLITNYELFTGLDQDIDLISHASDGRWSRPAPTWDFSLGLHSHTHLKGRVEVIFV
jgi:hypothetical protein